MDLSRNQRWLELNRAAYKERQGTPVMGERGGAEQRRSEKGRDQVKTSKFHPSISYIEGRLGGHRCLAQSPERLRVLERQKDTRSSLKRGPEYGEEPGSRLSVEEEMTAIGHLGANPLAHGTVPNPRS